MVHYFRPSIKALNEALVSTVSLLIAAKVRFKPYQTSTAAIARPPEVGIIRDGQPYGFCRPQATSLEQDDIVMAIGPSVP